MYNECFRAVDKDLIENLPESFDDKWAKAIANEDVLVGPKHFFVEPSLYDELMELFRKNEKDPYGIPNVCFSLAEPDDDRWEDWEYQRRTRGFDDTELWNLDSTIVKFILPRLKVFRDQCHGTPGNIIYEIGGDEAFQKHDEETHRKADERWMEILDTIIWSLENYDNEPECKDREKWLDEYHKWKDKINEGLMLLAKYLGNIND